MVVTGTLKNNLPRFGLGMAALGRPGYINLNRSDVLGQAQVRDVAFMQEQANDVMDEALRLGVNWFDCARSYGKSEQFVGEYLRGKSILPHDVTVSSKWGYTYVANWNVTLAAGEPHEVKDHSAETFHRQLDETIECLGEYVELYQIHSATFESGVLRNTTIHEALERCKTEQGWKIGLSVSSPKQGDVLREAMTLRMKDGKPLFDSVQCTYNLLEQNAGDALMAAHEAGIDIIIKEGLANGRLLSNEFLVNACNGSDWKSAGQVTPDALALACILAQPFQPRVLSGAATVDHLVSNFNCIELAEELINEKQDLLSDLMKQCKISSGDYWKDRSALAWN